MFCSAVVGSLAQLVVLQQQQQQHAVPLHVPGPAGRPAATVGRRNGDLTRGPWRHVSVGGDRQGAYSRSSAHSSLSHHRSPPEVGTTTGFGCGVSPPFRRLDPVLKGSTISAFQQSMAYQNWTGPCGLGCHRKSQHVTHIRSTDTSLTARDTDGMRKQF